MNDALLVSYGERIFVVDSRALMAAMLGGMRGVTLAPSLWRVRTRAGTATEFVDWYHGRTRAEAVAAWREDCARNGLPMDKTSATFERCDNATRSSVTP